jgi:uncharacterized protein YbbC (DUF1343 family)
MQYANCFTFKNRLFALITALISIFSVSAQLVVGANRTESYLPLIKNKSVGVVANATSVIFKPNTSYTHLIDSLLAHEVRIRAIFTPEHGFRTDADAGEAVASGVDPKTGINLVSLYGENKKPRAEQLEDIEILLFDIQDVGVRFYTYIATLQLVMEAAADAGIKVIVLDRPNPNASYVDGPVLQAENASFLGFTPIPLVYGMTIGEYALMLKGEGWLETSKPLDLTVIELQQYSHQTPYSLPIKPSPNLPNDQAIAWYPTLGLFEGTEMNAGRGTAHPFQSFGSPDLNPELYDFRYTPMAVSGAQYPKHKDALCYGLDLRNTPAPRRVSLEYLITSYRNYSGDFFRPASFAKHSGRSELQQQIESGMSEQAIRSSWNDEIEAFKRIRVKYLRYP